MSNKAETPEEDDSASIRRLAKLSLIEYDRQRNSEAKRLRIQRGTLDKLVDVERKEVAKDSEIDGVVEELVPWGQPVSGSELLHEVADILQRHVILPPGGKIALSLWVMGSYCMDAWQLFPKLLITSPTKRCGKSVLLEVLESMAFKALVASNISPSAIFRCIEEWAPTLMLDEADTFTKDNDELNGIMNAGHRRRNAAVIRSEKDDAGKYRPRKFSVWCPQVIAGIGEQRGTMHDRSIHIEMQRRMADETVLRLPFDLFDSSVGLRRRLLRWSDDNQHKLTTVVMPPACGNDRAQDNWTPLFTLARAAGGEWSEKVREAYLIFTAATNDDSRDIGIMLLGDIKSILEGYISSTIFSQTLVDRLVDMEDRPWFEWKRGKPLTQNSLAKLLHPYRVTTRDVKIGGVTQRGYSKDSFIEVFTRYLTLEGVQSATVLPENEKGSTLALQTPSRMYGRVNFSDSTDEF